MRQVAFAILITFFILVSCTIINGEKYIADENISTEKTETVPIEKDDSTIEIESIEITLSTAPEIETTTSVVEETTIKPNNYFELSTPSKDSFKSYMDYRTITDKTSRQYKFQKYAYTAWHGIRMVDDRYCIAVGSYYSTTIGQEIDVVLENGTVIKCIVADLKDDRHTDSKNQQNPNGSVIEFIVDREVLHEKIQKVGDISYFDKVWNTVIFSGEIKTIRVYKEVSYEF